MKNSTLLIMLGVLIIAVTLFVYDLQIKAEIDTGRYRDPYFYFSSLPFKNFDTVNVNASTIANVKFVQGPYQVKIAKGVLTYVKLTQKGSCLKITVNFPYEHWNNPNPYLVFISCPRLSALQTSAIYKLQNKDIIDSAVSYWGPYAKNIRVEGFTQDKMRIDQDYGSLVELVNNRIGNLDAHVGISKNSTSVIHVYESNKLDSANFDILNNSRLVLNTSKINKLTYSLSDSARLEILGAAAINLKK